MLARQIVRPHLAWSLVFFLALAAVAALPAVAQQSEPAAEPPAMAQGEQPDQAPTEAPPPTGSLVVGQFERIPLPTLEEDVFHPYTILLPRGWEVNRDFPEVGVLLGPPGATPETHPEMLLVRQSPASATDPETLAETIRANADQLPWSPGELRVVDLGGVPGLWVRMDVDDPAAARRTVALKLPLDSGGSLDILGSAPLARYQRLANHYERLILSVMPATGDEGDLEVEDVEVMEQEPPAGDDESDGDSEGAGTGGR